MNKEELKEEERIKEIKSFVKGIVNGFVEFSRDYLKLILVSCKKYGLTEEANNIKILIRKLKS
ncbi:MAG: hypothetical protein NT052_01410 [Candidatus Shapirobacteria bacterium]|nr:hypothetical protein [Candidatus Shapirobacteria bacterium]